MRLSAGRGVSTLVVAIAVIVIIVLAAGAYYLVSNSGSKSTTTQSQPSTSVPIPSTTSSSTTNSSAPMTTSSSISTSESQTSVSTIATPTTATATTTSTSSSSSSASTVSSVSSTTTSSNSTFSLGVSGATTALGIDSTSLGPINSTASFTAQDPNVYVWMNFTNVQISESIGFYWYFPNGTEHFQSVGGSLPTGYSWDVGYGHMPLGDTPAADVTGVWHVLAYVGGAEILSQPFYVGSYTSPLAVSFSTLAPVLNSTTYYPINSTIYYTTSSVSVNSYVLFTNLASGNYNVTFDFITPMGTSYGNVSSGAFSGPSSSTYVYAYLDINGYPAASDPGTWQVLIYVNNNFSSPALVQQFFISG